MTAYDGKINLVIARNYRRYRWWFEHELEEPGTYGYVKDAQALRGYSADKARVLLLDDWWVGRSIDEQETLYKELNYLEQMGMEVHNVSST